jgi:hypothetical protein
MAQPIDDDNYHDQRDDYDDQFNRPRRQKNALSRCAGTGRDLFNYGKFCCILSGIAFGVGIVMCILSEINKAPGNAEQLENGMTIAYIAILYFGISLTMAIGGSKMQRFESYGWSMTAAILAIVSMICFSCIGIVGFCIGFGALVTLNNSKVKREFARQRKLKNADSDLRGD